MTLITKANIPANITTLEQLAVWSGLALSSINPQALALEGVGIQERACQSNFFYIPAADKDRILIRLSIELSPEYKSGGQKIWTYAESLSDVELPANHKV